MSYVWYACYGSNINRERFMRYIVRCSDTTPPVEDRPYAFAHPVFFGGHSAIWENKGTAFLDVWSEGAALGRIYKITEEQYREEKRYEGPRYQNEVSFEPLEGLPVVSFTCFDKEAEERNAPSEAYFETILEGLKETYPERSESELAGRLREGVNFNGV